MMKMIMKKILFCVAICALALTGCFKQLVDYGMRIRYEIKNESSSDIIVDVDHYRSNGPTTIAAGETATFWESRDSYGGGVVVDNRDPEDIVQHRPPLRMNINGDWMPYRIWTRKYWEFVGKVGLGIYTLTVDEEMLNSLLNNTEPGR